jgi:hypothetical protein
MWTTMGARPTTGGALNFDGTDDVATLGTKVPAIEAPKTVALWVRWDAAVADVNRHVFLAALNLTAKTGLHIGFKAMKIAVWTFAVADLVTAPPPAATGWHHIAYTFDGTTHILYIDAKRGMSSTIAGEKGAVTNLSLGAATAVGAQPWKGGIDEVRIYDHALTDAEIMALYTSP